MERRLMKSMIYFLFLPGTGRWRGAPEGRRNARRNQFDDPGQIAQNIDCGNAKYLMTIFAKERITSCIMLGLLSTLMRLAINLNGKTA